jgi:arylsulfatase A
MADDLGVGEPSHRFANSTHGRIHTPNIDALAKAGMTFTAGYAGYTVCAPSRATLFTGRNSGRLAGAPSDWPKLPQLLRSGGYDTAIFGKSAPMDGPTASPQVLVWGLPEAWGFDTFVGQPNQGLCHNMYPVTITRGNTSVPLPLNTKAKSRDLCMAHPEKYNYTTDMFADAAVEWLGSRSAADERPFFLYVSFTVPHAGGWGSAPAMPESGAPVPTDLEYASKLRDWPQVEVDHAASVSYLDKRIGDVLGTLERRGLEPSTLVLFASDNGAHQEGGHHVHFFDSTGGLRGFKRSYYEGGIRSPSLARWPGVTPSNSVSHTPWAFWDVLPTRLDVADIPLPTAATFDGRSFAPALRGEDMAPPEYLYWTWRGTVAWDVRPPLDGSEPIGINGTSGSGTPPGYGVRVGQMKGVVHACADQQTSQHGAVQPYGRSLRDQRREQRGRRAADCGEDQEDARGKGPQLCVLAVLSSPEGEMWE